MKGVKVASAERLRHLFRPHLPLQRYQCPQRDLNPR